jgi:hypothetical protein
MISGLSFTVIPHAKDLLFLVSVFNFLICLIASDIFLVLLFSGRLINLFIDLSERKNKITSLSDSSIFLKVSLSVFITGKV